MEYFILGGIYGFTYGRSDRCRISVRSCRLAKFLVVDHWPDSVVGYHEYLHVP